MIFNKPNKFYVKYLLGGSAMSVIVIMLILACSNDNSKYALKNNTLLIKSGHVEYKFSSKFTILYNETDPKLGMRPAGIKNVNYNIPTWLAHKRTQADLKESARSNSDVGDGFDSSILEGKTNKRTANIYNSGREISLEAENSTQKGDTIFWSFPEHELFSLSALIITGTSGDPLLEYKLIPKKNGYYSVGYSGAPNFSMEEVDEIWQPLIWQEKRFPENSFLTLAFRAPIPSSLLNDGNNTIGVLAAPEEFPFAPLPTMDNSRFGISIRGKKGNVQSQLFAPVLGGHESLRKVGQSFSFRSYLIVDPQPLTYTYEKIAREYYNFRDFRHNELVSLNKTFENIVDYSLTDYARYVDSLKGFAYSTDVPGAIKNVSSLHPIELSIVMDDPEIFEQKAYPMLEYMISREKFLFSLDPKQRIQHPSRALNGPIAPISELTSLYNIFNRKNPFLLELAKQEYGASRVRNLDVSEKGETWINAMFLFKATGEKEQLKIAKDGADEYLKRRIDKRQTKFSDPDAGGFFFWLEFTNRWIELLELYELTHEQRYLDAAVDGARHYMQFIWMSPRVPDAKIVVNKDGEAPLYWYLKSKGHKQMYYPEEEVDAWRLSEIGLTSESSGTSTGHRGIFMANYAPWMLRLGHYAQDDFLKDVAKSAIIGRYRNFPGYHINTARTTAYEKEDYPYHEHKELSVNSFHYNHIMPMASMLLDYLITDVWVTSNTQIEFPSQYIEGYAYLRNKFYGHEKGTFYGHKDVQLWMPKNLLKIDNVELNYITARKGDTLFIALTNQSNIEQVANINFNSSLMNLSANSQYSEWQNNQQKKEKQAMPDQTINVSVPAHGITALMIENVKSKVKFQDEIMEKTDQLENSYANIEFGNAMAMIFTLGNYDRRAYVYLRDDDSKFSSVTLTYKDEKGKNVTMLDEDFPFEFTVDIEKEFHFSLSGINLSGEKIQGKATTLGSK